MTTVYYFILLFDDDHDDDDEQDRINRLGHLSRFEEIATFLALSQHSSATVATLAVEHQEDVSVGAASPLLTRHHLHLILDHCSTHSTDTLAGMRNKEREKGEV